MSSTIKYKGATIATAENNTKTLQTSGKYLEGDIEVTDVSSGASIGTKIITANGQYDASDDGYDGYSEIDVNVPNTYSASDEGKVVSNGALVSQTSTTFTENGTYDTTLNDEVVVNVSGGGGWTSDEIASRGVTGDINLTGSRVYPYAFYGYQGLHVSGPNVTLLDTDAFAETGAQSTFDLPNVITANSNAFYNMYGNLYLPKCTTLGNQFQRVGGIGTYLALPKLTSALGSDNLRATFATILDLGYTPSIGTRALYQGNNKSVIILRKTDALVTLANGALTISSSEGCDMYAPADLLADYAVATNWSTYNLRWHALEGSIYESETWPED